ncbi:MAG: hypothetical protein MUP24_06365 [Gillisia sp.]|nr:hypothetical protein [Gillisia sp.]
MKRSGKIVFIILSVTALFLALLVWYKYEYSMGKADAFQVNSANLDRRLLIATQESAFKDSITQLLVKHYTSYPVLIKVIDISSLSKINPADYTAIAIIHTWENQESPFEVKSFIERTTAIRKKIIVLTTSSDGTYKMKEVDAITGESKIEDAPQFADKLIGRLDPILKDKN